MLLASTFPVFLVSAGLIVPGVIWAWWRYPARDGATRLAVGIALGFAFQIQIAALLAAGPRITATSVLVATVAGCALAGLLVWLTRHHAVHIGRSIFNRESAGLVALLALVVAPRLLPMAVMAIPPGWDTSFHSLLASTTVHSGRLPTWQPFEPIPSNYPYGPHVFIAEISLITGLAPDVVFGVLIFAVQPLITCLALYALALRALRSHAYALGAVAAYGLLGNWGGIEYTLWGGLPNALGFFLVMVFLVVLFAPGFDLIRTVVGGLVLGAIPLTHHHVMLTTALLLGSYAAYLVIWALTKGRGTANWARVRRLLVRLALMCVVAVVSVSYYVIPVGLRVTKLGSTRAAEYFDDYSGVFFYENGLLLWELAMVGTALVIAGIYYQKSGRRATIALSDLARAFIGTAIATLLLAFTLGYYVYRYYAFHYTAAHQPYTLFTPTRFLTDMTYFLALVAGIPLAIAWQWPAKWGRSASTYVARNAWSIATIVARVGIAVVLLTACLGYVSNQINWSYGHLQAGEAEAFAWVKANTAANTLVVNVDPDNFWAPYFTQREVAYTPIPTSEFTAGYISEKQALMTVMMQMLKQSPRGQIVAFAGAGSAMRALAGRPMAIITDQPLVGESTQPAFVSGPERVYLPGGVLDFTQPNAGTQGGVAVQWWTQPGAPADGWLSAAATPNGWATGAPDASHLQPVMYLRLVLSTALPGAQIACLAENGADLFVDGQPLAGGCTDTLKMLPALSASGPHVIGIRMKPGAGAVAWYHVMLQAQGQ